MNNVVRTASHSPLQERGDIKHSQETLLPAVDIIEEVSAIKLIADMPGVTRESLKVELDNNVLSLEGEIALTMPEGLSALHAEVRASGLRAASISVMKWTVMLLRPVSPMVS